ncbi:MAG: NAD(P)/FAD-dependent oxidoreductase [Planctomycetota bacterium]
MDQSSNPVVIVGAGLSGLAAAVTLRRADVPVVVLEASDVIGGRVRTDTVESTHGTYLIDRGFQVYLDAYPEGRRFFDHDDLRLGGFEPGAIVVTDGNRRRVADPRRRPTRSLETAVSGVATVGDVIALARLEDGLKSGAPFEQVERPTIEALRDAGLSDRVIDRFFRPFFGGVFFDRDLRTSARMLAFTYGMFSSGRACLPDGGMGRLASQLAAQLSADELRVGVRVEGVDPAMVTVESGETIEARAVIVATDAGSASRLVPNAEPPIHDEWVATTMLAFDAPELDEPGHWLMLDGDGAGPVNHLAVPSAIQPCYAPVGRSLVYANTVGLPNASDDALEAAVRDQLGGWFPAGTGDWTLLRTLQIPNALPRAANWTVSPAPRRSGGIYICGDHTHDPSINGALASGRIAAEAVITDG